MREEREAWVSETFRALEIEFPISCLNSPGILFLYLHLISYSGNSSNGFFYGRVWAVFGVMSKAIAVVTSTSGQIVPFIPATGVEETCANW